MSVKYKAALNKKVKEFFIFPTIKEKYDTDIFLKNVKNKIIQKIKFILKKHIAIKFHITLDLNLEKFSFEDQDIHVINAFFSNESQLILTKNQINDKISNAISIIDAKYDNFLQRGSGWTLTDINRLILSIGTFKLFKVGCNTINLPPELQKTKGIIRMLTENDNLCFMYAVVLALTSKEKTKNLSRVTQYDNKILKSLPFHILHFPVTLKDILEFEKHVSFAINIYGYEFEKITKKTRHLFPYYISDYIALRKEHIDLLCYENHFYPIHNMSALLYKQKKNCSRKHFVCKYCCSLFTTKKSFETHYFLCTKKNQRYKFPQKKKFKEFYSWSNLIPVPFVIYADLESSIEKKHDFVKGKQISIKPHNCISWACLTVCRDNSYFDKEPTIYTGNNAIFYLIEHLKIELARISNIVETTNIPLKMSPIQKLQHEKAESCYICNFPFDFLSFKGKNADHNHLNGKYRGALCNTCNLKYAKHTRKVMIFFHGLSNYDSHFIIKDLHRFLEDELKVIPRTSEKYLSFSFKNAVFKDSYQFLAEKLETLALNLKDKGLKYFNYLNKYVKNENQRNLLFQKGIFPYNYIKNLKCLNETKLPTISCFFNDLTQENITIDQYLFAQKVWLTFNCQTLKDYLEVYLLTDILLLADVFENFRSNCITDYELDPCHYFSAAHYTFDAFLLQSEESIELLRDVNKYLMFQKMVRGGLCVVSKRFTTANHKYLLNYKTKEKSKYLLYLDANNLYGWAMTQNMPYSNFKWCEVNDSLINNIIDNNYNFMSLGFILEVDLEYPENLHDEHNDFPLAPEKNVVKYNKLSPFAKQLCDKFNLKSNLNTQKLITTFNEKTHYVLYYRNLRLYLSLGLKLKKIHRILQFKEKPFIKDYITFNSKKRADATNNFDINFYKFLSNSLFGKTMEKPENKTQIKFVNQIKTYEKYVSKLNFKQMKIITPKLVAMEMKYPVYEISKPFYIGAVCLEIAKWLMYNFHYNVMKKYFNSKINLVYTDTDSLVYEIETEDLNKDLNELKEHFDFSNYEKTHLLFSNKNKKVPGLFKNESPKDYITDFVGLKSKMYAFKTENNLEIKHAKGVKKNVIEQDLTFNLYLNCLANSLKLEHEYKNIRSIAHNVFTSHQKKTSLSVFDDKRWLIDSVHSLAYGHYKIQQILLGKLKTLSLPCTNIMAQRRRFSKFNKKNNDTLYCETIKLETPSDVTIEIKEHDPGITCVNFRNFAGKHYCSMREFEFEEIAENRHIIYEKINQCQKAIEDYKKQQEERNKFKKNKKIKTENILPISNSRKKFLDSDSDSDVDEQENKNEEKQTV